MKSRTLKWITSLCLFAALAIPVGSAAQNYPNYQPTFITFDPPGSISTYATAINPAGAITGYYQDASFMYHGFLRASDGTITTFDPPGSTGYYAGTQPLSVNRRGRSPEPIVTETTLITVSCVLLTTPSRRSIPEARHTPSPAPSTRRG
jgi:hypothetical protein